eukprot:gene1148-biopygen6885
MDTLILRKPDKTLCACHGARGGHASHPGGRNPHRPSGAARRCGRGGIGQTGQRCQVLHGRWRTPRGLGGLAVCLADLTGLADLADCSWRTWQAMKANLADAADCLGGLGGRGGLRMVDLADCGGLCTAELASGGLHSAERDAGADLDQPPEHRVARGVVPPLAREVYLKTPLFPGAFPSVPRCISQCSEVLDARPAPRPHEAAAVPHPRATPLGEVDLDGVLHLEAPPLVAHHRGGARDRLRHRVEARDRGFVREADHRCFVIEWKRTIDASSSNGSARSMLRHRMEAHD